MADIRIPQMGAGTLAGDSLFETAQVDQSAATGFATTKVSGDDIAEYVAKNKTYNELNTTSKKLIGAINELEAGGGGGGSSTLAGLSDVDITTPTDGQVLSYDSVNQEWVNADVGDASKVELTQAQYDALEQAGTLDPTVMYFITDGQSGNEIIDDSTTSASKVWSSQKTNTEIATVAATVTEIAKATRSGLSHPAGVSYFTFTALPEKAGYSRMVIGANPSIADILYVRFTEVNGDLRVYMNNTTDASASYDLTVAVAYIKN